MAGLAFSFTRLAYSFAAAQVNWPGIGGALSFENPRFRPPCAAHCFPGAVSLRARERRVWAVRGLVEGGRWPWIEQHLGDAVHPSECVRAAMGGAGGVCVC